MAIVSVTTFTTKSSIIAQCTGACCSDEGNGLARSANHVGHYIPSVQWFSYRTIVVIAMPYQRPTNSSGLSVNSPMTTFSGTNWVLVIAHGRGTVPVVRERSIAVIITFNRATIHSFRGVCMHERVQHD